MLTKPWSRRAWIASVTSASMFATDPYRGPILDTHVHFYDPTRPEGVPWPPSRDMVLYRRTMPADFEDASKGLGITGVIVVEASPWLEDNQWILDLAKEEPIVAGVVGNLDPGSPEFGQHLDRFQKNPLFRGIRIGAEGVRRATMQPEYLANLGRLSEAGLSLDVIGTYRMLGSVLRLSDKLPDLRIVIDHLPFDTLGDLQQMKSRSNVYAKVSAVLRPFGTADTYRNSLDMLSTIFGRDRLIYGSNWPVSNKSGSYTKVFDAVQVYFASKGVEAAERFFAKNAHAAYKVKITTPAPKPEAEPV